MSGVDEITYEYLRARVAELEVQLAAMMCERDEAERKRAQYVPYLEEANKALDELRHLGTFRAWRYTQEGLFLEIRIARAQREEAIEWGAALLAHVQADRDAWRENAENSERARARACAERDALRADLATVCSVHAEEHREVLAERDALRAERDHCKAKLDALLTIATEIAEDEHLDGYKLQVLRTRIAEARKPRELPKIVRIENPEFVSKTYREGSDEGGE